MNNIKLTAIRLIANAFLYSKEKNKQTNAYRFDSSFLTNRNITSIEDLGRLQNELNKLGWCFNILSFNNFIIQNKTFLAEVLKLGFGRVNEKTEGEIEHEYLCSCHNDATNQFFKLLQENFGENKVERLTKDNHKNVLLDCFAVTAKKEYIITLSSKYLFDEENIPDAKPLDSAVTGSCGAVVACQYGHGLLDLHAEAAWLFLCDNDRHDDGRGSSLGLPHDIRQVPVSCHLPCGDLCRGLSIDGYLWFGSYVAHGTLDLEIISKTY